MEIYLPIAHMDANLLLIALFGAGVGFLSGLVGVGGGFLITPLLMFLGVSPLVAVGTASAQTAGTSAAGSYTHWRLGNIDFRLGTLLLIGSWIGGGGGVALAHWLEAKGQFGNIVSFLYVGLLGFIGISMLAEAVMALRRGVAAQEGEGRRPPAWLAGLPWQKDFPASGVRLSVWVPLAVGIGIGLIAALMGVGGGFLLVPVMVYLLAMPTRVAVGTSLFQQVFMTALVTLMQAGMNHAVDPFLALALIFGASFGSQWGSRFASLLPGEKLRLILALVVLAVAAKMLAGLLIEPVSLWTLRRVVG